MYLRHMLFRMQHKCTGRPFTQALSALSCHQACAQLPEQTIGHITKTAHAAIPPGAAVNRPKHEGRMCEHMVAKTLPITHEHAKF